MLINEPVNKKRSKRIYKLKYSYSTTAYFSETGEQECICKSSMQRTWLGN